MDHVEETKKFTVLKKNKRVVRVRKTMRFYKPMMTIGGENYTFVVGFKSTFARNLFVH